MRSWRVATFTIMLVSHAIQIHADWACPDLRELEASAAAEGHLFVARTRHDWESSVNRFDRTGEVFVLAIEENRVIGMCGVNKDPYVDDPAVGRLRHLYVDPDQRRSGIASNLVVECLITARSSFERIRLRTSNPTAAALYLSLGFATINATATHERHSLTAPPDSRHCLRRSLFRAPSLTHIPGQARPLDSG